MVLTSPNGTFSSISGSAAKQRPCAVPHLPASASKNPSCSAHSLGVKHQAVLCAVESLPAPVSVTISATWHLLVAIGILSHLAAHWPRVSASPTIIGNPFSLPLHAGSPLNSMHWQKQVPR